MALSDLTNPQDPYRLSLENALYGRQADVINTTADKAQNQGREDAFSRGVGFSSILPDYTTAPIERERARALSSAAQNAFLGAGQEARANAAATNQPLQFAQSQGQQASQFQQMMRLQQQQLSKNANQALIASLTGGSAGLASLLLRPSGTTSVPGGTATTTLGGDIFRGIGSGASSGYDYLSNLFGPASTAADAASSGADSLSLLGTGSDAATQLDPEAVAQILSIIGF
jgi:hypothetical protein